MEDLYTQTFGRNIGVVTEEEQLRLRRGRVTIVGAGGVGGMAAIQCARMGIGRFNIIDGDVFEASNMNRQMLAFVSRLGQPKVAVAADILKDINPTAEIMTSHERVTEGNAPTMLAGAEVIIDATDNLVSRVIIHRAARELGTPSVWIAVTPPFRGGVMTLTPEAPPYEVVLRHPSFGRKLTDEVKREISAIKDARAAYSVQKGAQAEWADQYLQGKRPWAVLAPVANIVGALAAFEAFKVLIGRPGLGPCVAPKLTRVDLAGDPMISAVTPPEGTWDNATL